MLALDAGDQDVVRAWLEAHDRWLAWSGGVLGQADGKVAWARYGLANGDVVLARVLATEALALANTPDQPFVRLVTHRLLREIDTAADNVADAETHLTSALDLAVACEAPFERAETLLALAALRLAAGAAAEALSALDEVRTIGAPLGAAPLLARADALTSRLAMTQVQVSESYPAGLTQREVDVLRMLARRQTDKEIADALFVGHRTVQSHVAHILNKLGVANRREAATAAERLGLL